MEISRLHYNLAKGNYPLYIKAPILIISSWLFQGILYMDKTERIFKLTLDMLFILILTFLGINVVASIIVSHTLNWIFNGQIFVSLKNLRLTKTEPERFIQYLNELRKRVEKENSILAVVAFGSISRGQLKETSDLDVRIIRKKGLTNGIKACSFVLLERTRAFFNKFPLDIYVLDNFEPLSRLRSDEPPIALFDTKNALRNYYEKQKMEIIVWSLK